MLFRLVRCCLVCLDFTHLHQGRAEQFSGHALVVVNRFSDGAARDAFGLELVQEARGFTFVFESDDRFAHGLHSIFDAISRCAWRSVVNQLNLEVVT